MVGEKVNCFTWVGLGIGKWAKEPFWKVVFYLQLSKILILLKQIINNCFLIINFAPLFELFCIKILNSLYKNIFNNLLKTYHATPISYIFKKLLNFAPAPESKFTLVLHIHKHQPHIIDMLQILKLIMSRKHEGI